MCVDAGVSSASTFALGASSDVSERRACRGGEPPVSLQVTHRASANGAGRLQDDLNRVREFTRAHVQKPDELPLGASVPSQAAGTLEVAGQTGAASGVGALTRRAGRGGTPVITGACPEVHGVGANRGGGLRAECLEGREAQPAAWLPFVLANGVGSPFASEHCSVLEEGRDVTRAPVPLFFSTREASAIRALGPLASTGRDAARAPVLLFFSANRRVGLRSGRLQSGESKRAACLSAVSANGACSPLASDRGSVLKKGRDVTRAPVPLFSSTREASAMRALGPLASTGRVAMRAPVLLSMSGMNWEARRASVTS